MKLLEGLQELDETIAKQWRLLTCHEVSVTYDGFWFGVKDLSGNAEGFTGLSELLIVRFVINMLGGAEPRAINKELSAFQCRLDGRCWITHAHNVGGTDQAVKVDVGLWWKHPSHTYWEQGGELRGVIEIKLGLYQGVQEVVQLQQRFQTLQAQHPNARSLLVLFSPPGGPVKNALDSSAITYLILKNESKLLWRELFEKLQIGRTPFWHIVRAYP